MRGNSAI